MDANTLSPLQRNTPDVCRNLSTIRCNCTGNRLQTSGRHCVTTSTTCRRTNCGGGVTAGVLLTDFRLNSNEGSPPTPTPIRGYVVWESAWRHLCGLPVRKEVRS